MSTPQDARAALLGLRARVASAAGQVRQSCPLDLADLEAEASRMTSGIAAMPREQAQPLLPDLRTLLQDLERLEAALREAAAEAQTA